MEFIIALAACLIIAYCGFAGFRSEAFPALARMLIAIFSLLLTMRLWFPLSRWLDTYQGGAMPTIAAAAFWLPFLAIAFAMVKLRETYIEQFEAVQSSFVGSLLGGLFGLVTGTVVVTAAMMTLSLLAPSYLANFSPEKLPFPIDRVPVQEYRRIETHLARVPPDAPGHTLLPTFAAPDAEDPSAFWK